MNIKSIKIKKYKSISSPQTIEIGNGGLVTLIGKNGSGKTNILEAVNNVFEINRREYYYGRIGVQYSVILELDNDILNEFKENIKCLQDRFIEVYNNNNGRGNDSDCWKVNVFRSQMFAEALKSAASDLKNQASELSDKLKIFKKKLSEIQIKDNEYNDGYFYTIEDLPRPQSYEIQARIYDSSISSLLEDVDEIVKTIYNEEHEIKLNGFDGYSYRQHKILKFTEPNFHIVYREPYMTEFDKRFIVTIDRDKIKYYIEEFNK
ncbi:MAG: AAA family ATPase, partial [Clostridia bacterium]|nr:AAA family ATPase [Clostridia bacterium]